MKKFTIFICVVVLVAGVFSISLLFFFPEHTEPVSVQSPAVPNPVSLNAYLPSTAREHPVTSVTSPPPSIPKSMVMHEVPFVVQAPFAEWGDPRQEYGCEETSLIMVRHWRTQEPLTRARAKQEILAMSRWEEEHFGDYHDTSAEDTKRLFEMYYQEGGIEIAYDVTIDDIKQEIGRGHLVIVPVHGQKLKNPYFTPPGPVEHMIVVIGYDDATSQFIVHDPGTRHGANFRYAYRTLENALQDYPTGFRESIEPARSAMIVVRKKGG